MSHPYLLSPPDGNAKTAKCTAHGWHAWSLQLVPGDLSGHEVCPFRGDCFKTCLVYSGHGSQKQVMAARLRRTQFLFKAPDYFEHLLHEDLVRAEKRAEMHGLGCAVRLNAFSDIAWEQRMPALFRDHPDVQFYDYTKVRRRMQRWLDGKLPINYHLVYSTSERTHPAWPYKALRQGGCVVVVEREPGDSKLLGCGKYRRVDGDKHDLTFTHPPGSVIVLKPKGPARKQRTRFIP